MCVDFKVQVLLASFCCGFVVQRNVQLEKNVSLLPTCRAALRLELHVHNPNRGSDIERELFYTEKLSHSLVAPALRNVYINFSYQRFFVFRAGKGKTGQ